MNITSGAGKQSDDVLTVGEAAALLGVSVSTLRNWDRTGKLKARRHPINRYRIYLRAELERLLHELREGPL